MNIRSITLAVVVLVMSLVAGLAEDWTQKLYIQADAGYAFQQDTTLSYSASSGSSITTLNGISRFNSGVRGDIVTGYDINRRWAMEFDAGIIWNSMDQFNGNSLSSADQTFDTYTMPFLADLIYKIPLKGPWSAYVGAGAGGAATMLSIKTVAFDPSDYTFVFAYQAKAGLQYALTKNASLGIAYQFLGMTDPTWKFTQTFPGGIPPPTDYQYKEKGFYTHSIVLSFTWSF